MQLFKTYSRWMTSTLWLVIVLFVCQAELSAQTQKANFRPPNSNLWLGTYAKLRLTDKIFWDGQFHFRTGESENVPFVGQMAQIYNRHAVSFRLKPNFLFTVGPVLRLNFTPEPGNPEFKKMVVEPRIWHEYLFAMPYDRFMVYHRIRIEHRWSITNRIGDDWIFRNRYRYKFYMAIPINKQKLVPGAWYFTPDVEIIMQSGKPVGGSPLEDLRIYPQIGYIASPTVKYTAGPMFTTGQSLNDPYDFRTRWVLRFNVYLSLDMRKWEEKIPEIRIFD